MKKCRAGSLLILSLLLLTRKAPGAERVELLPDGIAALVRERAPVARLKVAKSDVRAAGDDMCLVHVEFPPDGLWEGVGYYARNGRIVAVSLTRGGIRPQGASEAIEEAVRLAIEQYGGNFERGLVLTTGDNGYLPCPLLAWKTTEGNVFLSFGIHTRANGAEMNHVRLTLAARDEAVGDLFMLPSREAEKRFLESDFDRVLKEALGTHVEGDLGAAGKSAEERGPTATSVAGLPRSASRPEGEEHRLRRNGVLGYVAFGAAVVVVAAAGAWLILRRRAGRRTA